MLRRDFLKVIGTMGAIATLPLEAITEVKEYPIISYEIKPIPYNLSYLHTVYGKIDNTTWTIHNYADSKILPNDVFLRMVDEINKKVLFS